MPSRPVAEGRGVDAVAHLANARTQNSGTGILGATRIQAASDVCCWQLFDIDRSVVTTHLKNIFESGELSEESNFHCTKSHHISLPAS